MADETLMRLIDAYADAAFDQGLHQRTEDDAPESKRQAIVKYLGAAPYPADRVPMPTNADQAAAMALLGEAWLRENAPERLKAATPAPAEPAAWLVLDKDGALVHAAAWREAAHEHINDAINEHGVTEAARWVVRPAVTAPIAATPAPAPAPLTDAEIDAVTEANGIAFLVFVEHGRRRYATVEQEKFRAVVRALAAAPAPAWDAATHKELVSLLCSVADNLDDGGVSPEWEEKTCRRATELLERLSELPPAATPAPVPTPADLAGLPMLVADQGKNP